MKHHSYSKGWAELREHDNANAWRELGAALLSVALVVTVVMVVCSKV